MLSERTICTQLQAVAFVYFQRGLGSDQGLRVGKVIREPNVTERGRNHQ